MSGRRTVKNIRRYGYSGQAGPLWSTHLLLRVGSRTGGQLVLNGLSIAGTLVTLQCHHHRCIWFRQVQGSGSLQFRSHFITRTYEAFLGEMVAAQPRFVVSLTALIRAAAEFGMYTELYEDHGVFICKIIVLLGMWSATVTPDAHRKQRQNENRKYI